MDNKYFILAQEKEQNWLFWEAWENYKLALLEFNKNKWFNDEKTLCKLKIREMNIEKSKSFITSNFKFEFTEEDKKSIELIINNILKEKDINSILNKIWKIKHFYPSYNEVKETAYKTTPISFQISDFSTQDDNWNLIKWWSENEKVWFHKNYEISQSFIIYIYLIPIFERLIDENKLSSESLINYFKNKNIFKDDFINIIKVWIDSFFENDYISTLHILIPKFEKLLLDLTWVLSNNSIDTISSRNEKNNKIWTQDKTLWEDFLNQEDVKKVWGEDFCEQIKFVFFSQLWFKLRHKIAHWYSEYNDFSFQNSILIIYFYIVIISRLEIWKIDI